MIILQKLKWDNCFSYGEGNELDLSKSTLTQLVGTNGVGKSSIPLILEEVLFNKNSKNVKRLTSRTDTSVAVIISVYLLQWTLMNTVSQL